MKVVLDSGIFIRNFRMTSPSFETFLHHHIATGHQFVMLEVVFDEVINKYREFLSDQKKIIDSKLEEINKNTGKQFESPLSHKDISSLHEEYIAFLRKKLEQFKAIWHKYPEIPHQKVVERALQRKKPFDTEGNKGYRDVLIWESILELISKEPSAIGFVSLNPRDFADKNSTLYSTLQEEVSALGRDDITVIYFQDLETFVANEITPRLDEIEDIKSQLVDDGYKGFDLLTFTLKDLHEFIKMEEIDPRDIDLPYSFETLQISYIEDADDIDNVAVYLLAENNLLVTYEVMVSASFTFFIENSEYYGIPDELLDDIEIWNSEWNDHYMLCHIQRDEIIIKINLVLDQKTAKVQSAEIVDISFLD